MAKFLFQIEKEEKDDKIEYNLFYVNEEYNTICEKASQKYRIITTIKDYEKLNIKSENIQIGDKPLKNQQGHRCVAIDISNRELYDYIQKEIKENKLELYEADLLDQHRYLIDNDIKISQDGFNKADPFKKLYIDIETIGIGKNTKIVSIGIYCPENINYSKVYLNSFGIDVNKLDALKNQNFLDFKLEIFEDEKKMLEIFKKDVVELSPQMVLGWNVIDFDFKVIKERFDEFGINFNFTSSDKNCKLRVKKDFFSDSSMECSGMLILDVIHLLKSNFIIFEDYKLNTVAKEVLGDEKIDLAEEYELLEFSDDKMKIIEKQFTSNPGKLIEYNFKDAYLTHKIVEKLDLIELICKRSQVTNTPLSKVKSPIATLDIMYLKELHKKNLVAPSNFNYTATAPIEGAFVIEPSKGYYNDIFVLDFKSLYPSIIMTFNIDPFSISKSGQIIAPNHAKFDKTPAILPSLIRMLYDERDKAKKDKDKVRSFALKTTMNSFYGAVASPKSRLHNRDVGQAITAFGREIIRKAKEFMEKKGCKVVYGDTDSIFISLNKSFNGLDDKIKHGKQVEKELNKYFEDWVNTVYSQKSYLTIELEKIYSNFFIASKKRYVGYDEFTKELQFVGMEAIRGDWTQLAKNFQVELIKLIFSNSKKEKIKQFILDYVNDLKSGKFDSLLEYRKKTTKPLNAYTKTTPPHVKAAREVKGFSGRLVRYVMTIDGPKHISLLGNPVNYDYLHYIEKQLKGVSDDILDSFGIDFDEVINSTKQKSLSGFFN